jgi:serine/threonine-protein kinase HipA
MTLSQLSGCVAGAGTYFLSDADARAIIDHRIDVIRAGWDDVCDLAAMSRVARQYCWGRQFLNPYALQGYSNAIT